MVFGRYTARKSFVTIFFKVMFKKYTHKKNSSKSAQTDNVNNLVQMGNLFRGKYYQTASYGTILPFESGMRFGPLPKIDLHKIEDYERQ